MSTELKTISAQHISKAMELIGQSHDVETASLSQYALSESEHTGITAMAAFTNAERLDRADLIYILSHPDLVNNDPEIMGNIRQFLNYPRHDPQDLHLEFITTPLAEGGQSSVLKIIPSHPAPYQEPFIFFTGALHPNAIYLAFWSEVARVTGQPIIMVESPTMGGSKTAENASVYHQDLIDAAVAGIKVALPDGGPVKLAGHSLGSMVLAGIMDRENEIIGQTGIQIIKWAPVTWVPTEEERDKGMAMSGVFMKKNTFEVLAHGEFDSEPEEPGFSRHTPEDKKWCMKVLSVERWSSSMWAIMDLLFTRYNNSFLSKIGEDPRLRVVLADSDDIIRTSNLEEWEGRRGVTLMADADHSFMAGQHVNTAHVATFIDTIEGDLDMSEPLLDQQALYRSASHGELESGVTARINSDGSVGLVGGIVDINGKVPFVAGGDVMGVYFRGGVSLAIGGNVGNKSFEGEAAARLAIGLEFFRHPGAFEIGQMATFSTEVGPDTPLTNRPNTFPYAELTLLDLEHVVKAAAQLRLEGVLDGNYLPTTALTLSLPWLN